jgi:hypothetical protein
MSQTGYTPILIYSSTTASQAPAAGNLTNSTLGSELAINITDGKLFYKDNANAIQVIGWKIVPATAGGTGQTSYAVGDILYADTTTSLAKLADVATGNALISGGVGVAPSWGKIGLTTHVSGTLALGNGGTGVASYTAGDLVYYASGTAFTKLGIGTANYILTSSGTAPQWVAPSTVAIGKATNLAGGGAGYLPYQSAADTTAFLAAGTANYLLQSNGAAAPSWVNTISLADSNGTSSFNASGVYIGQGTAFTSGASEIYTTGTRQLNAGTAGNAAYAIFTNSTNAASFDASQFATFVNQALRTISVGTIAGSGSATITLKANPGGTKYYGFDVFVTGYENSNGGTIYMKAQVICNWVSGTINQRGIGSTNYNESLGVGDYRAFSGASLSIGASSNNLTLTITNSGGSSITNVVVTVQDHFS